MSICYGLGGRGNPPTRSLKLVERLPTIPTGNRRRCVIVRVVAYLHARLSFISHGIRVRVGATALLHPVAFFHPLHRGGLSADAKQLCTTAVGAALGSVIYNFKENAFRMTSPVRIFLPPAVIPVDAGQLR